MHKVTATWSVCLIGAATLALSFIQPTIIHQLVVWVSGAFAVLVVLALFVVNKWPEPKAAPKPAYDDNYVLVMTKHYRNNGYSDANIATALNVDIDVIGAIPR